MAALEHAAWGFHVILRHGPREVDEQLALPGVFGKLQMEPPEALHVERGEPRREREKAGIPMRLPNSAISRSIITRLPNWRGIRLHAGWRRPTDSCTASMTFMRPCSPSKSWTGRLRAIFRSS